MKTVIKPTSNNHYQEEGFVLPIRNGKVKNSLSLSHDSQKIETNSHHQQLDQSSYLGLNDNIFLSKTSENATSDVTEIERQIQISEESLQELRENTYELAYKEGFMKGHQDATEEKMELIKNVNAVIDEVRSSIPDFINQNQKVLANVVFEAILKMVGSKLIDPVQSFGIIEKTLSEINPDFIEEIIISNQDYDYLDSLIRQDTSLSEFSGKLDFSIFRADPSIRLGGCKLRLTNSNIDASLDEQLTALYRSLYKHVDSMVVR